MKSLEELFFSSSMLMFIKIMMLELVVGTCKVEYISRVIGKIHRMIEDMTRIEKWGIMQALEASI